MKNKGWVSLHRKLCDNPLWLAEKFTRGQAWIDLIILANHKPGYIRVRGNRINLERGQCGWSVLKLSHRWKWSRDKTTRFLNELVEDGQIVKNTDTKTTVLTICNYSEYQDVNAANKATDRQQTLQQTDNRQGTNNNNNNNNHDNNLYITPVSAKEFEVFWTMFPRGRKGNKEDVKEIYKNVIRENRATEQEIIDGLQGYINSGEYKGKYASSAGNWLSGDKWEWDYSERKPINKEPDYMDEVETAHAEMLRERDEDILR